MAALTGAAAAIPFAFPGLPRIGCLFGTALGGTAALERSASGSSGAEAARTARSALREDAGLDSWVELDQVHGDAMLVDPAPTPFASGRESPDRLPVADGSMTDRPGLGLCIRTADCQPLFLAHSRGRIAALHVGWRGNRLNFPGSGAARFCAAYGLDPAEVLAVRGPSLGPGASEFVNHEREWPAAFLPWFNLAARTMDLWSLTRDQLLAAGLKSGNIFALDLCTLSLPGLFFSYRRKESGRQMSIIWIRGA